MGDSHREALLALVRGSLFIHSMPNALLCRRYWSLAVPVPLALPYGAHTMNETPQPIYGSRREARKHKPLPKRVRAAIRKRSAYKRIEKELHKRSQ